MPTAPRSEKTAAPVSPEEALIYTMVSIAAVDRDMADIELGTIGDLVAGLPVFSHYDSERLIETARDCGEILRSDNGLGLVLEVIRDALTPALRETAYALAVEVAAVDLDVEQEELRFLELLRDRLEIDPLVSAAIERSARVRLRML
ncbi:tellurite resistance TerB family protein [Pseudoxanthobacter sp.]|uniref:tellurite resistance TerB family protein n=1 Tax=Pseudoxanthobacter sp. TaxID=1925742 RepID=UPI002FE080E6